VRRSLAGETEAFTQLAARHKVWLFRFIRRYVGNDDDAKDLLQESLVSAWQALHRFDLDRSFQAWLRQIALNKCRDWSRRSVLRRIVRYISGDIDLFAAESRQSNPEAMLAVNQALQQLDTAIASLPRGLREPLILTVFEGLSQREAAQQLRVSEKAVETRIYRARQRLADVIDKSDLSFLIEDRPP
jgi:RNA polymerase sigma-70 factor (ECF subfamily)